MSLQSLRAINARNWRVLRESPSSEISGALGDLGTLLPLLIALTLPSSISLASTLVFTGVANILTGIFFGLPLPVQPMKAIAAAAISQSFSRGETAAAGILVGAAVGVGSATGLLRWFARVVPIPVVKGIQVGAGLSLVLSAGSSLLDLGWLNPRWSDNLFWVLGAAFLILGTMNVAHRFPTALVIFLLGILLAILQLSVSDQNGRMPSLHTWRPTFLVPSGNAFGGRGWPAALGQLPLTTLNSIVAVSYLSADLIPSVTAPSTTALGYSVALMNLVGCWFGAMPACHGSGGLAAQYHFGARSGASVILLGGFKVFVGLVFGESLVGLLHRFPRALLGIMVLAAGLELAKVGESLNVDARDLWEDDHEAHDGQSPKRIRVLDSTERKNRWTVMLLTVGGLLGFRNDAVGLMAGMLGHASLHAGEYWEEWRYRGRGSINHERQALLS